MIKKSQHNVKRARSQAQFRRPKIPQLNRSRTPTRTTNLDSYKELWKACHDKLWIQLLELKRKVLHWVWCHLPGRQENVEPTQKIENII